MMTTKSHEGFVVRCRGCGGRFHELTENYRPVPPMRGDYLWMLKKHRGNGWYAFPERDWVIGDNVQCPQCGTPYTVGSIERQLEAQNGEADAGKLPGTTPDAPGPDGSAQPDAVAPEQGAGNEEGDVGGADDLGIYDGASNPGDVVSTVMKMTREGHTQTGIAETCQISVYMVRQIQNGKKV